MTLEADNADAIALREEKSSSAGSAALRHVVINLFNLIILLPLAWVLLMSVKSLPDSMRSNFWPKRFDFTHYGFVFQHIATLPINLFNSIYVTTATVLITTFCAVLAGYALVHIKPLGAGVIVTVLLVSLYFPVRVVSIISIYETQHWLGLINHTSGLILPYITLQLAISILIMRSMFQLVPHEMFESARIDGAGHWRALWEIGLPMVRNGLVVIFIVNFVSGLGRISPVPDAHRRRGQTNDASRSRCGSGRTGTVGVAEPRRGLRNRRHPRHHCVHAGAEALLQGASGGSAQGVTLAQRPVSRLLKDRS